MMSAMKKQAKQTDSQQMKINLQSFENKNLEDFVITMSLFQILDLPVGYLSVDPALWEVREDYKQAKETIQSLNVVNDHVEHGRALIQEYSGLITNDEMQLQF
ncbi:hypothetical protein AVEN_194419-1 [Araneus ventricosus]|uniref:Uncharacterized protein n=1 Tax=Araneus ventricosus TaxID=182803 RepID=A0A4Y2A5N2_ARAVE|nr:hypothetical protein AVEN_194419-1 [Araneus ventricosus]